MFSNWRAENQERSLEFNCDYCTLKERYKHKVCFVKNKQIDLDFPIFDEHGVIQEYEQRNATKEDVIQHLIEVHKLMPNVLVIDVMSTRLMLLGKQKEKVCPIGLFDYETDFYVSLETAASKYHVLPYEGAYLDQPLYLIEAFDTCRAAESKYNNAKMNKVKEKGKKPKK